MKKAPQYSEELQGFVDVLQGEVEILLPDERPTIAEPRLDTITDSVICRVVVRGGRNYVDWTVPEAIFGDDAAMAQSLSDAIAKVGLAGIIRVVAPALLPQVEPDANSNVIPPNPAASTRQADEAIGSISEGGRVTLNRAPQTGEPGLPPLGQIIPDDAQQAEAELGDDPDAFLSPPPPAPVTSKSKRGR